MAICNYCAISCQSSRQWRTISAKLKAWNYLSCLYGCEPIISNFDTITTRKRVRIDGVIDFYENWNDYAVHDDKRIRMNEFARVGAKIAILNLMLKDARRNSTNASATKGTNIVERIEG